MTSEKKPSTSRSFCQWLQESLQGCVCRRRTVTGRILPAFLQIVVVVVLWQLIKAQFEATSQHQEALMSRRITRSAEEEEEGPALCSPGDYSTESKLHLEKIISASSPSNAAATVGGGEGKFLQTEIFVRDASSGTLLLYPSGTPVILGQFGLAEPDGGAMIDMEEESEEEQEYNNEVEDDQGVGPQITAVPMKLSVTGVGELVGMDEIPPLAPGEKHPEMFKHFNAKVPIRGDVPRSQLKHYGDDRKVSPEPDYITTQDMDPEMLASDLVQGQGQNVAPLNQEAGQGMTGQDYPISDFGAAQVHEGIIRGNVPLKVVGNAMNLDPNRPLGKMSISQKVPGAVGSQQRFQMDTSNVAAPSNLLQERQPTGSFRDKIRTGALLRNEQYEIPPKAGFFVQHVPGAQRFPSVGQANPGPLSERLRSFAPSQTLETLTDVSTFAAGFQERAQKFQTEFFGRGVKKEWENLPVRYTMNSPQLCQGADKIDVLFVIHSHPQSDDHRQRIRQTFVQESFFQPYSIRHVFLVGTTPSSNFQNNLNKDHEQFGDVVQGDFIDTPANATYKGIMGLKWVTDFCSQAQYVMKIDEDVFVDTDKLLRGLLPAIEAANVSDRTLLCPFNPQAPLPRTGPKAVVSTMFPGRTLLRPHCKGYALLLTGSAVKSLAAASQHVPSFFMDELYLYGILPWVTGEVQVYDLGNKRAFNDFGMETVKCYTEKKELCPFVASKAFSARMLSLWQMVKQRMSTESVDWNPTAWNIKSFIRNF